MLDLTKNKHTLSSLYITEIEHLIYKKFSQEFIKEILVEYVDPKLKLINNATTINFKFSSYFDYLVLPLLDEEEVLNLNVFLNQYFACGERSVEFKNAMDKTMVFEDLVEIVILIRKIHAEFIEKQSVNDAKTLVCLFYFRQMKILKDFHAILYEFGRTKNAKTSIENQINQKELEILSIQEYRTRIESKMNLLHCIHLFQKKNAELVY